MSRNIRFSEGEYYHLYNRGVEKRDIYLDDIDYKRFVFLLYLCNGERKIDFFNLFGQFEADHDEVFDFDRRERLVSIGAYCLMPNHFHILVREKVKGGISRFMQKISTAYTMYFNDRYEREGSLFQGTFKAKHIKEDNEYLKYLYAYIHLNPIKLIDGGWGEHRVNDPKKSGQYVASYPYSSFKDLGAIENRAEGRILTKEDFPEYFKKTADFKSMVQSWIAHQGG